MIVKSSLTHIPPLFCSGCPAEDDGQECRNPFNVFQGCMRLLTLDNQDVDLIMVQQKELGTFSNLQIDMCGIIDRSVSKKLFTSIYILHSRRRLITFAFKC